MLGRNKLLSAEAMVFSLAAIILVFLKYLRAAAPCMAPASVRYGLRIWNSNRKYAVLLLVMAAACAAAGIYFAVC